MKQRAGRNNTMTIGEDERQYYAERLHSVDGMTPSLLEEMGDGVVLNGDMLDAIKRLPDGFADLIIIDPPYNLHRKFDDTQFLRRTDDVYESYLRSWLPQVCRKLSPRGSLYLCADWKCSYLVQKVLSEHLTILNRITWQRDKGRGARSNWKNSMEDIWFAVADPKDYFFDVEAVKQRRIVRAPYKDDGKPKDWKQTKEGKYRMTCPSNFWDDITVPFWAMHENTDHPTQKPEKLIAKLILASSRDNDIVFDPFLGSGTTAVVAKKLHRRYVGVEISEEYCMLADKRILLADADPSIQGYHDGVFWERNSVR